MLELMNFWFYYHPWPEHIILEPLERFGKHCIREVTATSLLSLLVFLIVLSRRDKAFFWTEKFSQQLVEMLKFALFYDVWVKNNILEALEKFGRAIWFSPNSTRLSGQFLTIAISSQSLLQTMNIWFCYNLWPEHIFFEPLARHCKHSIIASKCSVNNFTVGLTNRLTSTR